MVRDNEGTSVEIIPVFGGDEMNEQARRQNLMLKKMYILKHVTKRHLPVNVDNSSQYKYVVTLYLGQLLLRGDTSTNMYHI